MAKYKALTSAFYAGKQLVIMVQHGDQFKILKKCINYVRGKNVECWRVMGSASTFDNFDECLTKFSRLVNKARKAEGKSEIVFEVENNG